MEIWFDPEMTWLSAPCGRPGRPMRFSDSAIELCLTLKVLFNLPLRQTTGLVASVLKLAGLDWPVPDYTTLCRRQRTLPAAADFAGGSGLWISRSVGGPVQWACPCWSTARAWANDLQKSGADIRMAAASNGTPLPDDLSRLEPVADQAVQEAAA